MRRASRLWTLGPASILSIGFAVLLGVAGLLCVVVSITVLVDHADDAVRHEVAATRELISAGRSLRDDIVGGIEPAIAAGRSIAQCDAVRRAIRLADQAVVIDACNEALRSRPEIDAVALFGASGQILGINSVYADGTAIARDRLDRILMRDFSDRAIISQCANNTARTEIVEFQTSCDITPALFGSSGLSVAVSIPILDEAGAQQIGIASCRLRFERLTSHLAEHPVADGFGHAYFVSDAGRVFDESINAGRAPPPVPVDEIRGMLAPLAAKQVVHSFVGRNEGFLGVYRVDHVSTLDGGGVHVMVWLPTDWVVGEAKRAQQAEAAIPGAFGLLLLLGSTLLAVTHVVRRSRFMLRRSERFLGQTLASMDAHIAMLDASGRIVLVNDAWRRLCRENGGDERLLCEGADYLAACAESAARPGHATLAITAIQEALGPIGRSTPQEYRCDAPGLRRWFHVTAQRVDVDDESFVCVTHQDVTDLRALVESLQEAQTQAEAASRSKSEFLANMSHEIRTPMTAILGYAELIAGRGENAPTEERRLDCVETIRRNGEHLLSIINDILDISKIEAGKMTVERIAVEPVRLIDDVVALMGVKSQAKGLRLVAEFLTPMPATLDTDAVRLRQILVNLVGNAIKFTEHGGVTLRIACDPTAERLVCEVEDTGIGLSPNALGRLFGAFEQADTSTTRRFGGTGLGLRISKRLAEMLGGDISVRSEPGKGSVFTLSIATGTLSDMPLIDAGAFRTASRERLAAPRLAGSPVATQRADGGSTPLAGVRILLAEDGEDNVRLITHHLRRAGAIVTAVGNGRLAVQAMTCDGTVEGPLHPDPGFDLLLSDMQMPDMDGYEAARTLRGKGCTLPIIALTAHAMSGDLERCTAAGCDGYATKPIDREHLIEVCRQAAAREAGFYRTAA